VSPASLAGTVVAAAAATVATGAVVAGGAEVVVGTVVVVVGAVVVVVVVVITTSNAKLSVNRPMTEPAVESILITTFARMGGVAVDRRAHAGRVVPCHMARTAAEDECEHRPFNFALKTVRVEWTTW